MNSNRCHSIIMNEQSPSKFKILAAFGAIYIIWGSTYLAIRYAVESIPPFFIMGSRSMIAGLILYLWGRSRSDERIQREHWHALFIIGTFFFLIGQGFLAWAELRLPSGLSAVLVASQPLWAIIIESFFLHDARVKWRGIIGLMLGFAGIAYLIVSTEGIDASAGTMMASLAIIAGAISWSAGAVYARVARLPKSPLLTAGGELIAGGALLLITGFILGEGNQLNASNLPLRSLFSEGYLIVFGSVIAFSAYIWLLGHTSVTRISTHAYVNPALAVVFGLLFSGVRLSIVFFF